MMQTPALAKELTSGTLYKVYKNPKELMSAMFSWLEGNGGVLAQMRMQANGRSPVAAPGAATEYKVSHHFSIQTTVHQFIYQNFLYMNCSHLG
jgi:hypothetical protein